MRLREYAISQLLTIDGVQVVAPDAVSLPHLISIVAAGVSGEATVRELASRGFDVDSGSACSAEDLQPSHVLAAMGYKTDGHIRFTLHSGTTQEDISALINTLRETLQKLRR